LRVYNALAMGRLSIAFAFVVLALAVVPAQARAQAQEERDRALARSLFTEGVELAQQERHAEAADRFRRARALVDAPAVTHNLATSLGLLGRVVEACELLRSVTRHADADAGLRRRAQQALEALEPLIARLTIRVQGNPEGAEMRLDGQGLQDAALGVPVPVDPGNHVVVAIRDGEEVASESVVAEDGGTHELVIVVPAPVVQDLAVQRDTIGDRTSQTDPLAPGVGRDEEEGGGVLSQWWFWTAVVAVAAGATVAVVAATGGGVEDPISGTTNPGVLTWR